MTVTRAITIRAPWALAIAAGRKTVENRGRPTSWRGPVAIHTATTWSREGAQDPRIREWWWGRSSRLYDTTLEAADFANACRNIIAVADLTDCHEATLTGRLLGAEPCCQPWGDRTYQDKPAWHLVFDNIRRIDTPVPAGGRLTVPWQLSQETAERVNAQLRE